MLNLFITEEEIHIFERIPCEQLLKLITYVFNPPHKYEDLSRALYRGPELPPQPRLEYIDCSELSTKIQVSNACRVFQILDSIVSLMPYSKLKTLKYFIRNMQTSDLCDLIREWSSKICENSKILQNLKSEDLRAEDTPKSKILLLAPSDRQFRVVINNWDKWVWKRTAYDGSQAPQASRWLMDIAKIAHVLRDEGLEVVIAIDRSLREESEEVLRGFKVMELDIPEGMAKVGYVRDQSVTWFEYPILCNMALDIRRGEEEVLCEIYHRLGIPPVARARWIELNGKLVRSYMEGGNFFIIKSEDQVALLTGIGVRGSNIATIKFLSQILPDDVRIFAVPIAGYIKYWSLGAVHLDVVFAYIGEVKGVRLALADPSRMGFYSILEYDRRRDSFKVVEFLKVMKELDVLVDEPPRESYSPITMVNALNLGGGKIVSDSYNKSINQYLEREFGVDVIEVEIPQIEAGGGGVRCATRELWI